MTGTRRGAGGSVVVIGASGSVGRQVCAAFAARGEQVVAVARHDAPHLDSYAVRLLDVTGTPPDELAEALDSWNPRVVINAAGRWGPTDAEREYSHAGLVHRLVSALGRARRAPRLIHVGSIHEYGPQRTGTWVSETEAARPANAYARTKAEGSRAVLAATDAGLLDGVVLRAANMYGPHPPAETFLADVLRRLRETPPTDRLSLTVAPAQRDYLDVRDFADAVVAVAGASVPPRLLNLGTGIPVPIRTLVGLLLEIAGRPADLVELRERAVSSLGGEWTAVNAELARERLGWRVHHDARDSMRAMWDAAAEPTSTGRSA